MVSGLLCLSLVSKHDFGEYHSLTRRWLLLKCTCYGNGDDEPCTLSCYSASFPSLHVIIMARTATATSATALFVLLRATTKRCITSRSPLRRRFLTPLQPPLECCYHCDDSSYRCCPGRHYDSSNIGALIIFRISTWTLNPKLLIIFRISTWGPLYYNYNEESPK